MPEKNSNSDKEDTDSLKRTRRKRKANVDAGSMTATLFEVKTM
jgi:hypothetical protein